MIWYLIKNNLKLMFRNKAILATMVLGPVFVIAMLSSAFDDLMKSYEEAGKFKAGYQVEEGSFWENNIETIKKAGEEWGITFLEYPDGNPEELVKSGILSGFVKLGNEKYTIYENEDKETEGIILEYFFSRCLKESTGQAVQMKVPGAASGNFGISLQKLDYMPAVNSSDYYGIIEMVYFGFLGVICIANVFISEKKNGIMQRFQITSLSCFKLYLAKWIPAVAIMASGILAASVISSVLFGIHWGNLVISAILVLLVIMAGISFGLMINAIFKNMAVTVIILFTSTFFMGFFGGSFETYMYSRLPETLKNISPVYHVNRALVEHSCMGHSGYTSSCILYFTAIIITCTVIAVLADWAGKRGKGRR